MAGLTALVAGWPAEAATSIASSTTTPVLTSTANGGAADDVSITSDGSVKPESGVAVTLDSDNTVTNAGTLYFHGVDNTTGVLIQGGHTGGLTNSGTIEVDEDDPADDTDDDGDDDGAFATGSGRYGVRLTGSQAFVGDINLELAGSIIVRGNDSAGVLLETALQGTLLNAGSISVVGDRVFGVRTVSTVSGDVILRGGVAATGGGAIAVQLDQDVAGSLLVQSTLLSTGYRYTSRSTDTDFLAALDADDLLQGGSALVIRGDVAGGVLLEVAPVDYDEDVDDEDGDGYTDTAEGSALVATYGAAPAMVIGASGRTVTLGNVGTGDYAYGIVNRGAITADGVYDGIASNALQIGVAGGAVDLSGGFQNQGSVTATAYEADAVSLRLLSGSKAPLIVNNGVITATITGETAGEATAIRIESGADVWGLYNGKANSIVASVSGEAGDATAIRDLSGTLVSLTNQGVISAVITATDDSDDTDDSNTDSSDEAITGQAVAIDLAANTSGVRLLQSGIDDGDDGEDDVADDDADEDGVDDADEPAIVGKILLGSGADTVQILNGAVVGDIALGAGANQLTIDGGAVVTGALSSNGGTIALAVGDGELDLTAADTLDLSSLNLGSKSVLNLVVDPDSGANTRLQVAGQATVASGAQIGLDLKSLLLDSASYVIIDAASLDVGTLDETLLGATPYLYKASFSTDAAAGTLSIDLVRKTATEVGLPASISSAYEPLVSVLNSDAEVRDAFLALKTRKGFLAAYNQMLPEHSGAVFQTVAAQTDAFARAIDDRQGPDAGGVWVQEAGFLMTRDATDEATGYKAGGFGIIAGTEWSAGRFGVLGATLGGASAHVDPETVSGASNMTVNTVEGGTYWRLVAGDLTLNARLSATWLQANSHRAIYLLNDDADTLLAAKVADGKWNGYALNGRVAAAYEARVGSLYARPSASLDYLRLEEGGYDEKNGGDAVDLHVSARQSSRSTAFAGVVTGTRFGDQDAWWGTEMTLGYREIGSGGEGSTTAKFLSGSTTFNVLADEIKGGGAVARIAIKGENAGGAFVLEGGAESRDSTAIYDLRLAAHFRF